MQPRRKNSTTITLGALLVVLVAGGCSYFSSKPDLQVGDSRGFHASASANQMPVPLPVEIADDIKRIANGEQIEQSTAWKKTTKPSTEEVDATVEQEPLFTAEQSTDASPPKTVTRARRPASGRNSSTEKYTVKSGDTLMKISFEKYGNVYRWREILDANKDKIRNFNALIAGTVLTVNGVEYVVIEKNGKPYLIHRNDTLVKISRGLYGAPSYWRNLWQNNLQLIHDPNKIYTGFTLYYSEKPEAANMPLASAQRTFPAKVRSPAAAKLKATKIHSKPKSKN
jgi:LysM repeat protein